MCEKGFLDESDEDKENIQLYLKGAIMGNLRNAFKTADLIIGDLNGIKSVKKGKIDGETRDTFAVLMIFKELFLNGYKGIELATELEKIINSLYLELDYKKRSGRLDPNTALKTGSKLMSEILNKFGSEIEKIEETKIEKIEEKENDPLVSTLPVSPEIIGKKEKNIPPVPKLSVSPEMIGKKESLQNSKRGYGLLFNEN
uniref:Uncharacterized protein n=1 Tax=Meloidogyne javanica TaxID=6303 RepID=A0A915LHI9_MELJA